MGAVEPAAQGDEDLSTVRFGPRLFVTLGALALGAAVFIATVGMGTDDSPYPNLGKAAAFSLIDEHGEAFALSEVKDKVVLMSFMFTRCYDLCPILTSKLADMQEELSLDYGGDVYFVSVTVDPEYDRPEVLKEFAENLDYNPDSWSFLTGEYDDIRRVASSFGVLMAKDARDSVNHNLLTTVIDRKGIMRIQYLGEGFDTDELLADIRAIADQARG